MFAIRFVVLAILTFIGYVCASQPIPLSPIGHVMAIAFFVLAPALYLLPIYEANVRKRHNIGSIAALNVFLGWTVIGWVVALVWALSKSERPTQESPDRNTIACPFCAEEILAAAKKCKHCRSEIPA